MTAHEGPKYLGENHNAAPIGRAAYSKSTARGNKKGLKGEPFDFQDKKNMASLGKGNKRKRAANPNTLTKNFRKKNKITNDVQASPKRRLLRVIKWPQKQQN